MSDFLNIPTGEVASWSQVALSPKTPNQISSACPHCGIWCLFQMLNTEVNKSSRIGSSRATCPSCKNSLTFVYLYPNVIQQSSLPSCILLVPAPKLKRPEAFQAESVPENVAKAFENTLRTYLSRNFTATTVMGRRTLEGVFLSVIPERERRLNLHQMIEAAAEEVDFAEPLKKLAHAIRAGGNLGAHFDPSAEPDELMAQQMVELLDYLISYLFVWPARIKELEKAIDRGSEISSL